MFKKLAALVAVLSVLTVMLGSVTVLGEGEPVPDLTFKLNQNGTTSVRFVQQLEDENADQTIEQIRESFSQEGFTVEKGENPTSVVISKDYPAEKGYVLDLSLPYGLGESSFVEFKDFFVNRYGIKNTSFNTEKNPEGQTYLNLIIETPVKASYSNATTRDASGKINTWKIVSASKNEINLNFKRYNVVPLISTIFGLAVLLVLIYLVITTSRKNKANIEGAEAVVGSDEELNLEGEGSVEEETENPLDEMDFDTLESEISDSDEEAEHTPEEKKDEE